MNGYGVAWQTPNHLIQIAAPRDLSVKDYAALRTPFKDSDEQHAAQKALADANGESRALGGDIYFWTQDGPAAPKLYWVVKWDMHSRHGFEDAVVADAAMAFRALKAIAGVADIPVYRGHTYLRFEDKMWEENAYNAEIAARIEKAQKIAAEKPASPEALADVATVGKA